MAQAYIALDSDAGARPIREALRHLRTRFGELAVSPSYRRKQDVETVHLVARCDSILPLSELLRELGGIASAINRDTAPPPLDLSLLLLGSAVLRDGPYLLPHPELNRRAEWLVGLSTLDPGLQHPALGTSFGELADSCGRAGILPFDYPIT